jgi:hypothetical protein
MDRTVKRRDAGGLRHAVIGTGMAVPSIAAMIWMRFHDRPPSTVTLKRRHLVTKTRVCGSRLSRHSRPAETDW